MKEFSVEAAHNCPSTLHEYGIIGTVPAEIGMRMVVEAAEARIVTDRGKDYPGDWPIGHPRAAIEAVWIQVERPLF